MKMTDDNPSMGIKTKACVNGVYPDTIPTINQNISDIQEDIGNIEDELENGVVHTTGNETVAGNKTFSDTVYADDINTKALTVHGDTQLLLGTVALHPNSNGANIYLQDSQNKYISLIQGVDGDKCYLKVFPYNYYPEDEDENPVAPSNDVIMTSGLVAVDPRIVHTTGNETVAGTKTFEDPIVGHTRLLINGSNPTIKASKPSVNGEQISMGFAFDGDPCITAINGNGGTGGIYFEYDAEQSQTKVTLENSYYPVDSDDNPTVPSNNTIMTSGMIGVDPRIVHTTGNEIVAGTKQGDFRGYALEFPRATTGSKWLKYCSIPASSDGKLIEIFSNYGNNGLSYGLALLGGTTIYSRHKSIINCVGEAYDNKILVISNKTLNVYEIWCYVGMYGRDKINNTIFSFKYGYTGSDITYNNEEYDNPPSGDDYITPVYLIGSA